MRSTLSILFLLSALALVSCSANAASEPGESSLPVASLPEKPASGSPLRISPTPPPTSLPTSSAAPHTGQAASYPDLGAAPELANEVWLNAPAPLRLADLRGKVVLLDMWTFG